MKLDLTKIKPSRTIQPPRIILYGTPKIGKSYWASNIKGAIFLDIEGGTGNLSVNRIEREQLQSYDDVLSVLTALLTQEHEFTAVVIDSADFLEKLLEQKVADQFGKKSFAEINGYRREYVAVANIWKQITNLLDDIREKRNMAIIMICHDTVKKVKDPMAEAYDRYTLALAPESLNHLEPWADAIMFAKVEVYTESKKGTLNQLKAIEGDRMLFTTEKPAFLAGNRYGLPDCVPFTWDAFNTAFMEAVK